jgi:predicted nucleic acid-binding protein
MITEVANALVRKTSQGQMKADGASQSFNALKGYRVDLIDVDELIEPSLKNACAFRHPIYDFIYPEVAHRFDARFITADRRFSTKLAGTDLARYVTLLSDWQPE